MKAATYRRRSPVPHPPADPALPGLANVLDPDVISGRLETCLAPGTTVDHVEPRQIDYVPGTRCTIQWRAWIADTPLTAVIGLDADPPDAHPSLLATDGVVRRRDGWDDHLGATIHWFPWDPALPGLAHAAAVPDPGGDSPAEAAQTLAYRPGVRAAVRSGDRVLKWYAHSIDLERAVQGFRWAHDVLGDATAELIGFDAALGYTAQPFVDAPQASRGDAPALGGDAGRVLRRIHGGPTIVNADRRDAERALQQATAAGELLSKLRPDLSARIATVLAHLREALPTAEPMVPSHGDFNVSQLLRRPDGQLVVLDFDELCQASPAYDLACYAANASGGRPADGAVVRAALDSVVAGYGDHPPATSWYLAAALLSRARSAFRLQKSKWPGRIETGLALAEQAVEW